MKICLDTENLKNINIYDFIKRKVFRSLDLFTIYELNDGSFVQMISEGGTLFGGPDFKGFRQNKDWTKEKEGIIAELTKKEALDLVNEKYKKIVLSVGLFD